MSTKAAIAIKSPDILPGKELQVYAVTVNYDGYPAGVGKTLLDHFNTKDAIIELIMKGEIRSIRGSEVEYYDDGFAAEYYTYSEFQEAFNWVNYTYVFDQDTAEWMFAQGMPDFDYLEPLKNAV